MNIHEKVAIGWAVFVVVLVSIASLVLETYAQKFAFILVYGLVWYAIPYVIYHFTVRKLIDYYLSHKVRGNTPV